MKAKIVCLPFAGGDKYSYRFLEKKINDKVILYTVEYPGRGERINDSLLDNIKDIVDDLFENLSKTFDFQNYAIYGHSMGGLVGYFLLRKIISHNLNPPIHIFISGCAAPTENRKLLRSKIDNDKEFLGELKKLNGIPPEFFKNKELVEFYMPILRADVFASESISYKLDDKVDIPMTIMIGSDEDFEEKEISAWQNENIQQIEFITMNGGHFFIYDNVEILVKVILANVLSSN